MAPLLITAHHAEGDGPEEDKHANHTRVPKSIDGPLRRPVPPAQRPREPVDQEAGRQDGEVQRRVVMMDVRDSRHGDEGQVMEDPADDGIEAGIVDVVDVVGFEFVVAALPADEVPQREEGEQA